MRTLRRVLIFTPLVLLALWALLGFIVVPRVLKAQLPEKLGAALHRSVTVGDIAFNPFTLELDLHDFAVADLASFHLLRINADARALVHEKIVLDSIELDAPKVTLTVRKDGTLSIADLLKPSPGKKRDPLVITVEHFVLNEGAVTFTDLSQPEAFTTTLEPLALELDDFSTAEKEESHFAFKAKLGSGELDYDGELSTEPLKADGKVALRGLPVKKLQPYIDASTQLQLERGVASISAHYTFDGSRLLVDNAELDINGLRLGAPKEPKPFLELARISLHASRIDPAARKVQLTKLELGGAVVRARRGPDRQIDLLKAIEPKSAHAPKKPAAPASRPWSVQLEKLALVNWSLDWADESLEFPSRIEIDQLGLDAEHLSWPNMGPIDVNLGMRWQQAGLIKVRGKVHPDPLVADLNLAFDGVSLIALDGYAWENGFNGTFDRGKLNAAAELHLENGKVAANGDVSVDDIEILDGRDKPLVAAKKLALKSVVYTSSPPVLSVETLSLSGGRSKISRDEKGVVNLARLHREDENAPPAPKGPELTVALSQLVFDDTAVDWVDKDTSPPFSSSTSRLHGRFTDITVPVIRPIGVQVEGRIDQAPTSMTGSVLPRTDATEADLKFTIEGYDLPHATPYTVKYVGQPVTSGKLSITVDAKVSEQKLDAQSHVIIDLLELGEKVEKPGPEAKSLPLSLAVAMLSDKDGRIDLTLPVTGDLASPQFKWGTVLWQVVLNLMEKVATSPLNLVRHLFAENGHEPEQLKALAFPPGRAAPADEEAAKLDSIAKLMNERPRLRLQLMPGVDPVTDRQALARDALRRKLLAQLERDTEQSELTQPEYERLVHAAWAKKAPDAGSKAFAEKEAELLAAQHVPREDLEALAGSRAEWCQSSLQDKGVPMTRVFVVTPAGEKATRAAVHMDVR
jgi:hypothetical protein